MLRLWLHISTRWFIIFSLIFFSSLSGLVTKEKGDQLFLRNNSQIASSEKSVKGAVSQSARRAFITSQVQELTIDAKKSDSLNPTPVSAVEWGTSKQLDEHTWTIQVGQDTKNATAQEILSALNSYRQKNGRGVLAWDDKLGEYANSRASYFISLGKLDGHAGFTDYVNNQDGFHKLGFQSIGENSSYGYTLEAVHLIEWVYAGDKPHDDNQLSSNWSYVGIGVNGTATDLIFGGKKL
jgi:uncharacterized protein YkwD